MKQERKIRILYLAHEDRMRGGANRSLLALIKGVQNWVDPIVVTPHRTEIYKAFSKANIRCLVLPIPQQIQPGSEPFWLRLTKFPLRIIKKKIEKHLLLRGLRQVFPNPNMIDIVHSNTAVIGVGMDVARILGAKHVWHLREFIDLDHGFKLMGTWKQMRRAVSKSDATISISQSVQRHFLKTPQKFDVCIYNAVVPSWEGGIIPSANEAASILAEHIAGSVEAFADMMNAKAVEIGCKDTHFVNPNGIHDENHYSTAYDLALMGKYAMQYDVFRDIASKTSCSLPATDKYPREDRLFNTTNDLLRENYSKAANNYYYPYATAGKTGYTDAAKNCIVATAKKDDISLLAVVLHGERTDDGLSQRALDCKTLFEYGFNNYKHEVIAHKGDVAREIEVSGGTNDSKNLNLVYSEDITALVPINYDVSSTTPNVKLTENLYAPISEGTNLGSVTFSIDGFDYSCDLLASHTVYKSDMSKTVIELCLVLVFLFLFAKVLKFKNKRAKKRYKHAAKLRDYSKNLDGFYPKYR